MSASGTVCPFQWPGPEVSKQQSHTGLDLVCDVLERGVRRLVGFACGGGVGDAPVRGDRRPRELRADLADLVAERDDPVESVAGEAGERLRGWAGDVDTSLRHDPYRVRMQRFGMAARAACLDGARRSLLDKGVGDLGSGAVAGAQEEQSRSGA